MSDSENGKRSSAFGWMIGILLVLVFYVASTGPVICCYEKFVGGNHSLKRGLKVFYYPVIYTAKNNKECGRVFGWYLTDFWGEKIFGIRVR